MSERESFPCPSCSRPVAAGSPSPSACPWCHLPLRGPLAAELEEVDRELGRLGGRTAELLRRRTNLLERLRASSGASAFQTGRVQTGPIQTGPIHTGPVQTLPVQTLLLALGALLLSVAGTIFTVLAWGRLGIAGRGAVLVGVTALAGGSAAVLHRRGLRATADAVACLTLVLVALDLHALRLVLRPVLAGDVSAWAWWAGASALLAGIGLVVGARVQLAALTSVAVLGAQLVLPLAAAAGLSEKSSPDLRDTVVLLALALTFTVVADLAGRRLIGPIDGLEFAAATAQVAAYVQAAIAGLLATGAAFVVDRPAEALSGSGALLVLTGALALAALLADSEPVDGQPSNGRLSVVVLAGAASAAGLVAVLAVPTAALRGSDVLGGSTVLLVPAGLGVALAAAARMLPARLWSGPFAVGVATTGLATLPVLERVVAGLLAPLGLLTDPWADRPPSGAADVLRLSNIGIDLSDCLLLGLTALAAGLLPSAAARRAAETMLVPTGLLVPAAVGLPVPVAVAAALVSAAALAAGGLLQTPPAIRRFRLALAIPVAGTALAWSVTAPVLTLTTVAVLAALAGMIAAGPEHRIEDAPEIPVVAAAVAGLLGLSLVPLAALALGGGPVRAGAVLAAAAAGVLLAGDRAGLSPRRMAVLASAGAMLLLALCLVARDPGWTSLVLTGLGLAALAGSFRPGRLPLAAVGALLVVAASWIWLPAASVTVPEAFTLPAALAALAIGGTLRHRRPDLDATVLLSPGLALGLLPTLALGLEGNDAIRPILLTLAAAGVVIAGSVLRLRAPLVLGGTVLAVIAVRQLGPLAAAAPRWAVLGIVGLVLLVLGARYERTREEVDRLRRSFASLG